jgi:pimeloyl-ACP methyl ester carboxylesterase
VNRWIFLRGLARSSCHWHEFPTVFKKYFPEAEIEFLDIRGNGDQAYMPSFTTAIENVRDLRSRSLLLKKGPVNLLSISLGSMIAIEWASQFPQDVQNLIVMNTSDNRTSHFWERLNLSNFSNYLQAIKAPDYSTEKELAILNFTAQNLKNKKEVAEVFAKMTMTSKENTLRQLVAAMRFRLPAKPQVPVLLIGSHGDQMVSPACTKNIEKSWNIEAVWHPSAGHEITLEEPEWVAQQLREFIGN